MDKVAKKYMEGGSLQLAAYGEQDIYLTGNPQMTYFVGVYKRYTHFSIEQVREYFHGTFDFGQTVYCRLSRAGDLVHRVYLWVHLPELYNDPCDPCYSVSWINSIGHALIQSVEIEIGGVVIDRHYGEWLEIWNELTLPDDLQYGYYDMIGKHDYFNSTMQGGEQILYIPLQFWFCRNIGLSLPLVAIQMHDVVIRFTVRHFEQCWTSSDGTLRQETPRILDAFLYVDHIFLDDAERRVFVGRKHEYLIEQLQTWTQGMSPDVVDYQIDLTFNHPTKAMFWIIKHDTTCRTGWAESGDEFFNFSDRTVSDPGVPEDPMLMAKIQLEGNDLMRARLNKYYREWVPYQYFARVPRNFIYCYSFALFPMDWRPSGTIDLSRVDNYTLNLQVKPNLPAAQINVYAINYNVLCIEGGMAGVRYKN